MSGEIPDTFCILAGGRIFVKVRIDIFGCTDYDIAMKNIFKNIRKKNQVNFTIAIYICREYLRRKRKLRPPDVVKLIEKHILPIRPGRRDPRKVKLQASVSFLYRVA